MCAASGYLTWMVRVMLFPFMSCHPASSHLPFIRTHLGPSVLHRLAIRTNGTWKVVVMIDIRVTNVNVPSRELIQNISQPWKIGKIIDSKVPIFWGICYNSQGRGMKSSTWKRFHQIIRFTDSSSLCCRRDQGCTGWFCVCISQQMNVT